MRRMLAIIALLVSSAVHAGSACEEKKPQANDFVQGMALAARTRAVLEASDAQVVLIARVGQDLSKYGIRYSHMAYAWRDHPQGRWLVVHELNQCGTAESHLFNEGLGNFFLDGMFAYEARVVVPSPEVQQRLAAQACHGRNLECDRLVVRQLQPGLRLGAIGNRQLRIGRRPALRSDRFRSSALALSLGRRI